MNLLDMVQALTQPDRVPMWVEAEGRKVLFTRVDPPLLDRVKARIGAEQGNQNGGGSPASQRSLIDANAFTLWHEVNGQVRSWFQQQDMKAPRELNQALSQWLVWFQSYPREVELQRHHEGVLSGWLSRALDVVDPPQRVEISSPCPACSARWVVFGSGGDAERRSALSAWLRSSEDCGAACGACDRRWVGQLAMRSLNVWIDEKRRATEVEAA